MVVIIKTVYVVWRNLSRQESKRWFCRIIEQPTLKVSKTHPHLKEFTNYCMCIKVEDENKSKTLIQLV